MLASIIVALLAASPETYVAPPNHFDKAEMGSEAVFAAVATCTDKALRDSPSLGEVRAVVLCGCLMDATRVNVKAGKSGPSANATPEQAAKCHALKGTPQRSPPSPVVKPPKGKAGV